MAKKLCAVCNKEMGALSMKTAIMDGVICFDCFTVTSNAVKIKTGKYKEYNAILLKELINQHAPNYLYNIAIKTNFTPTKSIDKYLLIDENNKRFMVGKDGVICDYTDLISFELQEDGETITKGGLGSAVVGGLLFGGAGAVVGAVVGGKKTKTTCEAMNILLTVKNSPSGAVYIRFLGMLEKGIKTDNIIYQVAKDNAQKCLSALQIIADENEPAGVVASPSVDAAAELEKFHALIEKDIITQDEFNAKKAQLLGL